MRPPSFEQRMLTRHKRETYTEREDFKYCASMFFWFYSVICFSGFNYNVSKDTKRFIKKIDTEILLALQLVKFTTTHSMRTSMWQRKPISYRDLTIVRGLIFDKKSERNKELREILSGTGYENILDKEPHITYTSFFDGIDNNNIDKINFKKFLRYLPKDMFLEITAWIWGCRKRENEFGQGFRKIRILGFGWGEIISDFRYSLWEFIKNPPNKGAGRRWPERTADELICMYIEDRSKYVRKLAWTPDKDLIYSRNICPTSDKWEEIMGGILSRVQGEV